MFCRTAGRTGPARDILPGTRGAIAGKEFIDMLARERQEQADRTGREAAS
jgi:hypothetical protein